MKQDGVGTEAELETGTVGTAFPGTERGEPLTATRKDRYRILRYFSPLLGWRHLHFTAQVTGFPESLSKPPAWKIQRCFRWKMPFAVFRSGSGVSDESRTGTARTVFQQPKPEPPCPSLACVFFLLGGGGCKETHQKTRIFTLPDP